MAVSLDTFACVQKKRQLDFSPKVAIVIPTHRHPVLVTEAIASALAQEAPFDIAIVVVDDGCPYPETEEVLRLYALAEPSLYYLRKPNGGLSSARNHAIDFALRSFPALDAVYFLDADNRITPTAIREFVAFMEKSDRIDWVYPNNDKFGIEQHSNFSTGYSRLLHIAFDNICEAGSLVSRRLLEAGIRFDETMKAGFEDWDFWLQAIGQGFIGVNHPHSGLEYRLRAESMLAASNRKREGILSYLREKHSQLMTPQTLLAFEHEEAPRYAAIDLAAGRVDLFTDPLVEYSSTDLDDFAKCFWAARTEPETIGLAPFLLWIAAGQRAALARHGVLHNVLWLGERLSKEHQFVALRLESSETELAVTVRVIGKDETLDSEPVAWMGSYNGFASRVDDPSDEWDRSLRKSVPSPKIAQITVRAPFTQDEVKQGKPTQTNSLLATLAALRKSGYRQEPGKRWIWRPAYLPQRVRYHEFLRRTVGAGPVMPRLSPANGPLRVGFLLPIATFGGVEKVAYAVARVLRDLGCEPHLFILGKPVYNRIPEVDGVFATINFLADDYPLWGGPNVFAGHRFLVGRDVAAKAQEVIGFLAGLDVVVNNHVSPVNAVLGALRQRGTRIVSYVHVLDRSNAGRPAGHPYLSLAFEHAYDAVVTCSRDLEDWLHAMGMPRDKLLHVPNAASYPLTEGKRETLLAARHSREPGRLRVLFLGRLDPQKGIERLHAAARELQRRDARIDWRIIGSDVMKTGAGSSWKERFEALGIEVEPPVYAARDLDEALAWADAVVLPSRWEGAPLTIIEAQRLGCVPVATAVGAVEELIDDDMDGLILRPTDDSTVVHALVAALEGLAENRKRLHRLSAAAAKRGATSCWERNVEPLVRRIEAWFPDRFAATAIPSSNDNRRLAEPRDSGPPAAPVKLHPTQKSDKPGKERDKPMKRLFVLNGGASAKPGNKSAHLEFADPRAAFAHDGVNTGDVLVYDAILKTLAYEEVENLQFTDAGDTKRWPEENRDATIIRGSNYLREDFDLAHVVPLLKRLKGPIVPIGVGAQAGKYKKLTLSKGSIEAWKIVADKCETLGVRGAYSAEVLSDLGIKNVRVIGCPSFYRSLKPTLSIRPIDPVGARVGLTLNKYLSGAYASNTTKVNRIQRALIKAVAKHPESRLYSQGEREETLAVLSQGEKKQEYVNAVLARFGLGHSAEAQDLLTNRMAALFDVDAWVADAAANVDVMVGFRLHGNIIALHQGLPAIFFTYDSRIRELASLFAVPSIEVEDFLPIDLEAMFTAADFSATERLYRRNFAEYHRFLDENGLHHVLPKPVASPQETPRAAPNRVQIEPHPEKLRAWYRAETDFLTAEADMLRARAWHFETSFRDLKSRAAQS